MYYPSVKISLFIYQSVSLPLSRDGFAKTLIMERHLLVNRYAIHPSGRVHVDK